MKKLWLTTMVILACATQVFASADEDAYIDKLLEKVSLPYQDAQITALKRLQWSGTSSAKLYDPILESIKEQLEAKKKYNGNRELVAFRIIALGYSGNPKYIEFLENILADENHKRIRRYVRNALGFLPRHQSWNKEIEAVEVDTSGLPFAEAVYFRMLSTNNESIQKLAVRAMTHERKHTPKLLDKTAGMLEIMAPQYLSKEGQDLAAWLCRMLGQNGQGKYQDLLLKVAGETPHPKVAKYATKYL